VTNGANANLADSLYEPQELADGDFLLIQLAAVRACGEKTFGEVRGLEMCSDL
jgi:hypothetical protein